MFYVLLYLLHCNVLWMEKSLLQPVEQDVTEVGCV